MMMMMTTRSVDPFIILISKVLLLLLVLVPLNRAAGSSETPSCDSGGAGFKIDCHPEQEAANEGECLRRGCCWSHEPPSAAGRLGQPSCFFPASFNCYDIERIKLSAGKFRSAAAAADKNLDSEQSGWLQNEEEEEEQEEEEELERRQLSWLLTRRKDCPPSGFPDDAARLKLELNVYGQSTINIKISEPDRRRFEPKLPEIKLAKASRVWKHHQNWSDGGAAAAVNDQDGQRRPRNMSMVGATNVAADDDDSSSHQRQPLLTVGELRVELGGAGSSPARLKVIHQVSGALLFETDLSKLIYSRQFVQLATYLPSPLVFGLGQHMGASLLKSASPGDYAKAYTMFNFGHPPQADGKTAYSSFPFYVNIVPLPTESTNRSAVLDDSQQQPAAAPRSMATGALMLNSNAMDVLLHSGGGGGGGATSGGITWRLLGGIVDLYLFAGREPHDVVGQYQALVGRPTLPPAWALGYHQSRFNYRDLIKIKEAWARTRSAGIPVEAIWTDLEFLWHATSYTLNNPELNDLVRTLQDDFGMHYVPIVDPAISIRENYSTYEPLKLATSLNLFAHYGDSGGLSGGGGGGGDSAQTAIVTTWTESGQSGLLDFTHALIVPYLTRILGEYRQQLNFDGIWLDMNEPEVFSNRANELGEICPLDEPLKYKPGNRDLHERTMCMAAQFQAGKHYDLHNIYAFYQARAHHEALRALDPSRRPLIISRSQFVGQGKYSGSWLGDLSSMFEHLRWSLLGTIESNWFGQPLIGADICGFFGTTTDELCARWFSLGAFYPFARNHNDGQAKDQDPGALGEPVQRAARVALMRRYSLLPFLYGLIYENHLNGVPAVSSMLFGFFNQLQALDWLDMINLSHQCDDQLVWGQALVVAPVMQEGADARSVYLAPGRWYDISIGLPGTDMAEGPYDALKSNWPTEGSAAAFENHGARLEDKLNQLRRPIDCHDSSGCLLHDQYSPLGSINLFLRGGSIIPTFRNVSHTDSVNTIWTNASFFLEIALDENQSAFGSLYWDSGESDPEQGLFSEASFWATNNRLVMTMLKTKHKEALNFDGFIVYGAKLGDGSPKPSVHGQAKLVYHYDPDRSILICSFKSLAGNHHDDQPLSLRQYDNIIIKW